VVCGVLGDGVKNPKSHTSPLGGAIFDRFGGDFRAKMWYFGVFFVPKFGFLVGILIDKNRKKSII